METAKLLAHPAADLSVYNSALSYSLWLNLAHGSFQGQSDIIYGIYTVGTKARGAVSPKDNMDKIQLLLGV